MAVGAVPGYCRVEPVLSASILLLSARLFDDSKQ